MPRPLRKPKKHIPRQTVGTTQKAESKVLRDKRGDAASTITPTLLSKRTLRSADSTSAVRLRESSNSVEPSMVFSDPTSENDDSATDSGNIVRRLKRKRRVLGDLDSQRIANVPAAERPRCETKNAVNLGKAGENRKAIQTEALKKQSTSTRKTFGQKKLKDTRPEPELEVHTDDEIAGSDPPATKVRSEVGLSTTDLKRLEDIKKQFEQVDQWSMEFETISSAFYSSD